MLDQAALAEIRTLQRQGERLTPVSLIDQARSTNSALHRFFTWDDTEAAHAFRVIQAKQVLKVVVRVFPKPAQAPTRVVATAAAPPGEPQPVVVAAANASPKAEDIRRLMADIAELRADYYGEEMAPIFAEIRAFLETKIRPVNTFGGASRDGNGSLSRFKPYTHGEAHTDRDAAGLPDHHPAVREDRTLFPSRVFSAKDSPHVLIPGHNNSKVGDFVSKGPWAGMNIFTLTLQERATCPRSCHLWNECYGNAMPLAKRWDFNEHLIDALVEEVEQKAKENPAGFVVRLHVLGDFVDAGYAEFWANLLKLTPQLHVFGYTAHDWDGDVGQVIVGMNEVYPDRCAIRFSVPPSTKIGAMQATTIWRRERARVPEGLVCPASSGDAEACGTCGLCWSPAMADTRIVFLGHGMSRGRSRIAPPGVEQEEAPEPVSLPAKATAPKPSDDEEIAGRIAGDLTDAERKLFAYLLADGSPRPVSGPAMSLLIRQVWRRFDSSLIAADGPPTAEIARLTALGRLVRGRVITGITKQKETAA